MLLDENFDACLAAIKFNENMSISPHSAINITGFMAPETLAQNLQKIQAVDLLLKLPQQCSFEYTSHRV